MQNHTTREDSQTGCGCGCGRRDFLAAMGTAAGAITFSSLKAAAAETGPSEPRRRQGATIRAAFLYPPSRSFADDPNGWWSWPGNDFDAEGRQKQYLASLAETEKKLGVKIAADTRSIANRADGTWPPSRASRPIR